MTSKRNAAADATLTLPGIKRPVGRPRKPNALTGAQRQANYRKRQKARPQGINVTDDENPSVAIARKLSEKQQQVLRYVAGFDRRVLLGGTGQIGRMNSALALVRRGLLDNSMYFGFSVTPLGLQCLDALNRYGNSAQ